MVKQDMNSEDAQLQFTFNGSLVNRHFEKILDIISEKLTSEKQLIKNKQKIIELLSDTFSGVTAEKLANGFNLYLSELMDNPLKCDTLEDINFSINRFAQFILTVDKTIKDGMFNDKGYSMIICCYFWLTKSY